MNPMRTIEKTIEAAWQSTRARPWILVLLIVTGVLGITGCTSGHGQHARLHQYRTMAPTQNTLPRGMASMPDAG